MTKQMKTFLSFSEALAIPLLILNALGGIVSFVWLAVLRAWGTIGLGILFFIGGTTTLSFILLPGLLFTALAAKCGESKKTFGMYCFGALDILYTLMVVTVWCSGVLYLFVKDATSSTLIPRLLWSYGAATGPLAYMASKEQQSGTWASTFTTFFVQLAYLAVMLMVIFSPVTLFEALKVFAAFMLVALAIEMVVAHVIQKEMRESANLGL